ncbi:MAG: tRNA (adenosine(37)-N6)-dimethylallyltransferase MiaA [Clostridia bacterium]|nr:tRNA (adenosine(37)-N6)-dimethylallyltransferase MiaA [Clostridia bacterium]
MKKLIAIEGTNASGKSGLGVVLAGRFSGEIVSADSRQVFRGLDLGSGKIRPEEMKGIPHHLIDVAEPNDFFSMRDFQLLACEAIDSIHSRGRVPFLVGGTGLYLECVTEGYVLSDKAPDLAYRAELEELTTPELYRRLTELRPQIDVDPKNRNRVMRILEKIHDGDEAPPGRRARYDCLKLGVTWPREELRRRIDERLEKRLREGMIEEVEALRKNGATDEFLLKLGLEYRFITRYLNGEFASLEEMKQLLATAIKQFAKRQMIWFRRDPSIRWLDMAGDPEAQASELIAAFLRT